MKISYIGRFGNTGSLCPSSHSLASAMFAAAQPYLDQHDEVLFAGIGSGVIAKLFSGLRKRVVFVDIDEEFCARFQSNIGLDHEVVCADFGSYLAVRGGFDANRLIISCLPMRGAFRSDFLRDTLLGQVKNGATVIFYTYLPRASWVRVGQTAGMEIQVKMQAVVLKNIPPAFVYLLAPGSIQQDSSGVSASV